MVISANVGAIVASISSRRLLSLPSSDGPDDDKRLFPGCDRVGKRSIRRFVGQVFFASEEPQERPPLLGDVIADGASQHGIAGF